MKEIRWALIPFLIGTAFALLVIYALGVNRVEFGDANDYIASARAFLDGTPYPRQGECHPMFRPPLFPLLIAGVWSVFPDSIIAFKFAQALLHGATCLVAFLLVYELLRKKLPALIGSLLCAINPLMAAHTADFYTEPLHTFLFALGILFVARMLRRDEKLFLNAVLAGIVFGLANLCRPSALGVVLCLLPVICLLYFKTAERFRVMAACVCLLFAALLTILPWSFYNYRTTGEFIFVNDGFSYNLWLGSLPETLPLYEGGFKNKEENQKFADRIWGEVQREKLAELQQTDNYYSLSFAERERVWRREALENLRYDYGVSARIMLGKIWTYWTPFLNWHAYSWKIVAAVALFMIGIYLLGIYGARVVSNDEAGRNFVILLGVVFVSSTAIHMLIMGFVRYRLPYVDPFLCLLAGAALWQLRDKYFNTAK